MNWHHFKTYGHKKQNGLGRYNGGSKLWYVSFNFNKNLIQ